MNEHPLAGTTVTLLIDGEEVECPLEEGISQADGEAFINSMLGIEVPEPQTEVDHPDLEFAEEPMSELSELEGFRTLCRLDGCYETEVFDSLDAIKDSEWTELRFGVGVLTEKTDLHYGFCPGHSLSEEEGYDPETDPGSHEYPVPDDLREPLEESEERDQ